MVDAAVQDAANRDHVCEHETNKVERNDGIAISEVSDHIKARVRQEVAYNATSEPMLIKDNRRMSTAVNTTALRGTSNEGSTFAIQRENGRPPSRANWKRCQR